MDSWGEPTQDNLWNTPWLWPGPNVGHRRSHPAELPFVEWDPFIRRWAQGSRILPGHKPAKFFTRPHDGKRPGSMGRFKDALSGEGADVFVTISGDKRTRMRDRPQRWQWTGWGLTPREHWNRRHFDKDWREQDECGIEEPFSRAREARQKKPLYDFNSRRYLSREQAARRQYNVLTNAQWQEGAPRDDAHPLSGRDYNRDWFANGVPWNSGWWPGGRPRWG